MKAIQVPVVRGIDFAFVSKILESFWRCSIFSLHFIDLCHSYCSYSRNVRLL